MPSARSWASRILVSMVVLTVLGLGTGAVLFHRHFLQDLPDLRTIEDYSPPVTSVVLDRHGRVALERCKRSRRAD